MAVAIGIVALRLAFQTLETEEEHVAQGKLFLGDSLNDNDCRALLRALWRNGVATQTEVNELSEHFFERYDFNDKVVCHTGQLQFV